MASYDRRTAPVQTGDRFNRPGGDRYGRAMSLGRWESDRSIEDRYGRGYEGDPLTISDFFRYGRERYSRPYDKVEPYRRSAQHRSQSLARLDNQRSYADDRAAYQGRYEEERFPRDYVMEERYARDYPEDRYTGRFFYPARSQFFDDRDGGAYYPSDRVMFEARPVFDRYGYDRFVYERPAGDRMFGERFYGPEVERFYRGSERFDAERHQEQSRNRDNQRAGVERFEAEHRDRYGPAKDNQRFDTAEGKDQRYGKDNRYNRQMRRQDDERKRNSRYRVENSSPGRDQKLYGDREQQRERKYSNEREQRKFYTDRERRERKFSTEREEHEGKFSEERDCERRLSGEREQNYSGDRERPTVDCTERFRKM